MSFTSEIKQELMNHEKEDCCIASELRALIRMNGVLATIDEKLYLDIQTENAAIARMIFTSLKRVFPYRVELIVRKKMKLKKNNVYIVRLKNHVEELFATLDIEYVDDGFDLLSSDEINRKPCCQKAYLRGAFLARGSVNNPETSSYHLEIFNLDAEHNHILLELMNYFELSAKEFQRRHGYIIYMKEAEKITTFLNLIGANNALFKFEDVRIIRDMRNSANRLVNCETANLNKTITASVRQVDSIKRIQAQAGLDILPEKLREIAEVRVAHPDISLKEVGELLPSGPLSKSGVNHRLKKIEAIAEKINM